MNLRTSLQAFACATALAASPARGLAQFPDDPGADRRRIAELLGRSTADSTQRSRPFAMAPFRALLAWNSELPYTLNDGPLWAGRGFNTSVTGGVTWNTQVGAMQLSAVIAPTISWSENKPFFVFPYPAGDRSSFASPWHLGRESADLPLRFGEGGMTTVDAGTSAFTVTAGAVAIGGTTAPTWWGPAIRNTLVLSSNAAGIPRVFVRTARPLRTAIGGVEAELMAGTLTESRFFDRDAGNDYRGVSGLRVAIRPAFDSGLTLGISRVVFGPASGAGGFAGHALDALTWWQPLASLSDSLPGGGGASPQERDQVTSLFGRWVFPRAGSEVYAEWARQELPRSVREFLESPQHTQGYTIGLQSARAVPSHLAVVRVQAEVTDLRQNQVYPLRPPPDFYSGRATLQGWTQRGQLLGAGIGPGANSQWFATDWLAEEWQAGAFLGRIRWEDDALYRQANVRFTRHDVSLLYGLRGGWRGRGIDYGGALTMQRRLNYLFQNETFNAGEKGGNPIDVNNVSITFTLTPR